MVRGLFGGRSTPQPQLNQIISTPTLIATDASPRDDLHKLGEEPPPTALIRSKPKGPKEEEEGPRTAGGNGRSRANSRADSRAAKAPAATIDQQLSNLPLPKPTATRFTEEENTIGIGMALGSPRENPNWESLQSTELPEVRSLPMTSILTPEERGGEKPKSQKWKKLFGGKQQHKSRDDNQHPSLLDSYAHHAQVQQQVQHKPRSDHHHRSFWDSYAQHAQVQSKPKTKAAPSAPLQISTEATRDVSLDRPVNPPPYSANAPPRNESLPVPKPEVRLAPSPSPAEEIEHEINKMMPQKGWNVDDSPVSPVDGFNDIPLEPPLTPKISKIEPPKEPLADVEEEKDEDDEPTSSQAPRENSDSDSESIMLQLQQTPSPQPTSFLDTGLDFGDAPLLNIDIPSIQMERYSVMFGRFLTTGTKEDKVKNDQTGRSSILARRQIDKHLERLKTIPDVQYKGEEEILEESPVIFSLDQAEKQPERLQTIEDDEQAEKQAEKEHAIVLEPPRPVRNPDTMLEVKPQRRATSPSPIRSPSFSLFPAASPKIVKLHGSNNYHPSKPSGLQRSRTAPGAISPNRPSFETTTRHAPGSISPNRATFQPTTIATRPAPQPALEPLPQAAALEQFHFRLDSPSQTTSSSSSNPHKWSSDGSLLSPASSVSVDDDEAEELIIAAKPLMPLVEQEEPPWEMVGSENSTRKPPKIPAADGQPCTRKSIPLIMVN
jgi:hypothetical protein